MDGIRRAAPYFLTAFFTSMVLLAFSPRLRAQVDTFVASMGDIVNAKARATRSTEEAHYGQAVGTSTVNAIGPVATNADVSYSQEMVQSFRVVNLDTTKNVCALVVARVASSNTCEAKCSAVAGGGLTCTGSGAADGTIIPPGTSLVQAITGLDCLCLEASSASANVNTVRNSRFPQ